LAKIGLFGGSFNPVHVAHLVLAEEATEALGLERVLFIPARVPPHKRGSELASARDRVRMARVAVAGNPRFSVSEVELRRGGCSYTIDTVRGMRRRFGRKAELYFLVGSDTVGELKTWRRIRTLARLCRFVSFGRPGVRAANFADLAAAVGEKAARDILNNVIRMPRLEISSSDIRRRVAEGRSIRYLVPDAVAEYIARKGLYRPG